MGEMGGNSKRMVVFPLEKWRMVTAASYTWLIVLDKYLFFFLLFQILGAVILGFGIWILADKTSFIAVLRKTTFLYRLSPFELILVQGSAWPLFSLGVAMQVLWPEQ